MKHFSFFLVYAVATALVNISCQPSSPYRQTLVLAGQIMNEHPDSAYFHLNEIPSDKLAGNERAEWNLLMTQAMDKLYIPHTSDSLIREAVNYFEKSGSDARKLKAYYYMGRVNHDLGEIQTAQEFYLKALKMEDSASDHHLLALIHSNLGMLYTYQGVYEEALPHLVEASNLFTNLNETENWAYVVRDIGRTCHVMDSIDVAIQFYEEALQRTGIYGRPSVLNELGNLYIEKKEYTNAERHLREALQTVSQDDYLTVCLNIGRLFAETGRTDSAGLYLKECMNSDRMDTKAAAYYYFGMTAAKEEHWKECASSLLIYIELLDSLAKQNDIESIRKIQSLFNYQRIEAERNQALIKKLIAEQLNYLYIFIAILMSGVSCFWWIRNKQQKLRRMSILQMYEKLKIIYDQKMEEYATALDNHKRENEQLKQKVKRIDSLFNNDHKLMDEFKKTEIFHSLNDSNKIKLTSEDKINLYATIDRLWPEFRLLLETLAIKISEQDMLMCYLMKAELNNSKISDFVGRGRSTITMRQDRLSRKLFGNKGSKEKLHRFIKHDELPDDIIFGIL